MKLTELLPPSGNWPEGSEQIALIEVKYSKKARRARFLFDAPKLSFSSQKAWEMALVRFFGQKFMIPVEVVWQSPAAPENPSMEEPSAPPTHLAAQNQQVLAAAQEASTPPAPAAPSYVSNEEETYYDIPVEVMVRPAKKASPASSGEGYGRFGKNDESVPLLEVTQEAGKLVTEGEIHEPSEILTRSGSYIFRFDLSDSKGGALSCKLFGKEKDAEKIRPLLKEGKFVAAKGRLQYDDFAKAMLFMVSALQEAEPSVRLDRAQETRVEIAVHTQMTNMEGTIEAGRLGKMLHAWHHPAVGVADRDGLQAYPLIAKEAGSDIKVLYGVQEKLLEKGHRILTNPYQQDLEKMGTSFTVFDLETTGFSRYLEEIIEIGAVRYEDGKKVAEFSEFVHPGKAIPPRITELTSITDAMVSGAECIDVILPRFLEFAKGSILVAHNAEFDVGFLRAKAKKLGLDFSPVWMDTLGLARALHPEFKNHKLDTITKELHVPLIHHHRAIDDATATGMAFLALWEEFQAKDWPLEEINQLPSDYPVGKHESSEILLYCPTRDSLKPLYEMISAANIDYFEYGRPGIPEDLLEEKREKLLVGSGLIGSRLFRLIAEDLPADLIEEEASKADFFVVQPPCFTPLALSDELVEDEGHYRRIVEAIIQLGRKQNKLVIATGTPSYLEEGERLARNILVNYQKRVDFDENGRYQFKTTAEMLKAFDWLPAEVARDIVVQAPRAFADKFEVYKPIPSETYSPELEGAKEELRNSSEERAKAIYGDPLPPIVKERLDRELNSIIGNGYSSLYVIARRLVQKSNQDGYLVGSRGSVGSSFVATMSGITEVNPLIPHYVCPECKHSEFIEDGSVESGFDLPRKNCPVCGAEMTRNGHTIPFEVFLGFHGDKEPDIDLNFAGEYMSTIHKYTEELFGQGKVFRAGTISGVQTKTAYGLIRKYMEQSYVPEEDKAIPEARIHALQRIMEGTRRTTGQHAGGLMIVPSYMDITDVSPIQYPADDKTSDVKTTHFSYKNLDHCLLKLDELGHTSPTIIRQLEEMTGINPLDIEFDDDATMSIFRSAESLKALHPYSNSEDGSLGIPEFGTNFVRGMLKDTHPTTFGELCRISGLSHGTDVWLNNAQDLIRQGKTTLKGAICTRDDIMTYLISMGMDKSESFKTMEAVRKGKGIPDGIIPHMQEHNVPDWYIDSCQRIKYMFPKAHATAYVMMSYRIAWFKVHHPAAFYATYFTQHLSTFSSAFLVHSLEEAQQQMEQLRQRAEAGEAIDGAKWALWEIIEEMFARGLSFASPDLMKSDAAVFRTSDPLHVLPPLAALDDVSEANGLAIVAAREESELISRTDLKKRAFLNKSAMLSLTESGLLDFLPESNQMSFLTGF